MSTPTGYSADDINISGIERVVLRKADIHREEMVMFLYPDKVILSAGASGMITLTHEQALRFSSEVIKANPLDALGAINREDES